MQSRNDWENQHILHINRARAHAPWGAYDNLEQALHGDREASPNVLSLDGKWHFKLFARADQVCKEFCEKGFDTSGWSSIQVPGNWELSGHGEPVYTNSIYPFPVETSQSHVKAPSLKDEEYDTCYKLNPPFVPQDNPTGCYVRKFSVPRRWRNKRVFVNFGGVESAYYLWVNGRSIGFSKDSKLASEFEITDALESGVNTVALQVMKWSDGTYLEDQDYWHLAGIHRSVRLYAKSKVHIRDWFVTGTPDRAGTGAVLNAHIAIDEFDGYMDHTVRLELFDADGCVVLTREGQSRRRSHGWCGGEDSGVILEERIEHIRRWSPDEPYCYTAVMTLIDPDGRSTDREACRIGFRRIEIVNHVIEINGQRMIFRGVNRHEHAYKTGRYVPVEHMRREIILMKQLNFNAVRTSHYPDDPAWYDLCDEYGLCLYCEANVETHGISGLLSKDPEWAGAYLERAMRMVLLHKNHPSIVLWSMGNESGWGPNHAAMSNWIRAYDPSRLVQYEAGCPPSIISDTRGTMYCQVDGIINMLADERDLRPVVLVEYLYQICNAGGGMYRFAELLERFRRFQGGFVWDWQDKCLPAKTADGRTFPGYGGDFGESFRDNTVPLHMTNNGVVLPDLTPKPVAYEIKQVQAPVSIVAADSGAGRFIMRNRHVTANTSRYALRWALRKNGVVVKSGKAPMPAAPAMTNSAFSLDMHKVRPKTEPGAEYHLDFSITLLKAMPWAEAGHEVYATQFELPMTQYPVPVPRKAKTGATVAIEEAKTAIHLNSEAVRVRVDRNTGSLMIQNSKGKTIIRDSAKVQVWRPETGMDTSTNLASGQWGFRGLWQDLMPGTLKRSVVSVQAWPHTDGQAEVVVHGVLEAGKSGKWMATELKYTINGTGHILVEAFVNVPSAFGHLPRLGLGLTLASGMNRLKWFGRGPGENYADRKCSTPIGVWAATVAEQHFPFIPPSECGGHEDARWITISAEDGRSLNIRAQAPFHFDARHSSLDDFKDAKHDHELPRRKETFLNLDVKHAGIGSEMAWSTFLYDEHRVLPGTYCFRFEWHVH